MLLKFKKRKNGTGHSTMEKRRCMIVEKIKAPNNDHYTKTIKLHMKLDPEVIAYFPVFHSVTG